jgi:hypothetical protein
MCKKISGPGTTDRYDDYTRTIHQSERASQGEQAIELGISYSKRLEEKPKVIADA